jgi:hypothetical protein
MFTYLDPEAHQMFTYLETEAHQRSTSNDYKI